MQSEIFRSPGYVKYVTQVDGSMDLLVKLAQLKRLSFTYIFNNEKIRKILSIQRRKETIKQTVQKLKEKLARWRKFTRTTLDVREEKARKRALDQDERQPPSPGTLTILTTHSADS